MSKEKKSKDKLYTEKKQKNTKEKIRYLRYLLFNQMV